jgi:hypothetical protein
VRARWPEPADVVADLKQDAEMPAKFPEAIDTDRICGRQAATRPAGQFEKCTGLGLGRLPALVERRTQTRQISVLAGTHMQASMEKIISDRTGYRGIASCLVECIQQCTGADH